MNRSSDSEQNHTLKLVNYLHNEGIENMAVLIRHGDRYYDREDLQNEAFMPLNEKGKQDAYEFGLQLPKTQSYRFFSSRAGRCIETAYQIEKGCIENGAKTTVNIVAPHLRGFFVIDGKKVVSRLYDVGATPFIQSWLRGKVSEKLMLPPKQAIKEQVDPIIAGLIPSFDQSVTEAEINLPIAGSRKRVCNRSIWNWYNEMGKRL